MRGLRGTPEERFAAQTDPWPGHGPNKDCWLWTGTVIKSGYGQLRVGGRAGRTEYAHRVAYELHNNVRLTRVREGGPLVCHTCDFRQCVNPAHLFLATNSENMQDMIRKGRQRIRDNKGEANPLSKLSPDEVYRIRSDPRGPTYIARDFAMSPSTMCQIKSRKLWSHLPERKNEHA